MAKLSSSTPKELRVYEFFGLDLAIGPTHALATCPWCTREGKFSIETKTGLWKCFVCGEGNAKGGGNSLTFLRMLWDKSYDATPMDAYRLLQVDRKLLYPDTLVLWNISRSIITGDWLVPGYNTAGDLCSLYRYVRSNKRAFLLAAPDSKHYLFGVNQYKATCQTLFICEGIWDAIALWETLGHMKESDDGQFQETNSPQSSMLATCSVIGIPGNNVWQPIWGKLAAGRDVYFVTQNDHPRLHSKTGKVIEPASIAGIRRISGLLSGGSNPPASMSYLCWGEKEAWDETRPSGYDVRDWLAERERL